MNKGQGFIAASQGWLPGLTWRHAVREGKKSELQPLLLPLRGSETGLVTLPCLASPTYPGKSRAKKPPCFSYGDLCTGSAIPLWKLTAQGAAARPCTLARWDGSQLPAGSLVGCVIPKGLS